MKFPSITTIFQAVLHVVRRFPVPISIALVATSSMLMFISHLDGPGEDKMSWLLKIWMVGQIGLSFTLGLSLWREAEGLKRIPSIGLFALGFGLLGWYYYQAYHWVDFSERQMIQYVGLVLAAHLFVSYAPYLNRLSVTHFWEYNKQLLSIFVTGMFYCVVLWLGISAGILATVELFQLEISERTYAYLFVFLTGLVNTFFFLYYLPRTFEPNVEEISEKGVALFCKYFLIPITSLYFLILYAFSAKILFTWTLPRGWVSALVIGFASLGIITWLLNYKLGKTSSRRVSNYYATWFWPVMVPMIVLLFVGLGRRISDYGFTPPLVIGVGVGVWLSITALYFLISQKDNIKFIPISLSVFVLLSLYGPLSMFSISRRSQVAELEQLLAPTGRWEAGQLVPSDSLVSIETKNRAYNILQFLSTYNDFQKEKPAFLAQMPDSLLVGNKRYLPEQIMEWMRLQAVPEEMEGKNRSIRATTPLSDVSIPAGFSRFFTLELTRKADVEPPADSTSPVMRFRIDTTGTQLVLEEQLENTVRSIDSWDVKSLLREWEADKDRTTFDPSSVLLLRGTTYDLLIVPYQVWFGKEADLLQLEDLEGAAFLRRR